MPEMRWCGHTGSVWLLGSLPRSLRVLCGHSVHRALFVACDADMKVACCWPVLPRRPHCSHTWAWHSSVTRPNREMVAPCGVCCTGQRASGRSTAPAAVPLHAACTCRLPSDGCDESPHPCDLWTAQAESAAHWGDVDAQPAVSLQVARHWANRSLPQRRSGRQRTAAVRRHGSVALLARSTTDRCVFVRTRPTRTVRGQFK